ncbi:MAG: PAS domain S-box protein [Candidatus Fermentibacteraceae bacterium]|nr:PAS domain S-box protein [Candidatus Fermentibacteraceae bacterium]MBN2607578.1 PAS domain S-box protein [Candidatus Fermentibacteraceae bacterium]
MQKKTKYLRDVISSLRQVDRLITREKDPGKLIREACRLLSELGGYVYSWILLLDRGGAVLDWAESGIGSDFGNLLDMASSGQLPACVRQALESEDPVMNRTDEPYCSSCRLKEEEYEGLESIVACLRHDGSAFGVIAAGFPVDQEADETQQNLFLEIAEDIAFALHGIRIEGERDLSLKSLRESEALLNVFLDHFPGPAFIRDGESRYLHVNRYFRNRFGPAERWVGKTPRELFSDEFAARMVEEDGRALEKGYHVYEKQLGAGDADSSVFEVHVFRIDRDGSSPLIGGIAVDITEWYRARQDLSESEEKYRAVFNNTGSATVIVDQDMIIRLVNRGFERLSGYTSEEICGRMKWPLFVDPKDLEVMTGYHRDRRLKERVIPNEYEFRFINRRGEQRQVHLQVDLMPGSGMSVCSILDITELKTTQEKLRESVGNMDTLLRTMPDIMFVLSRNGEYVDYRANDESLLAIPPDRILGSNVRDLDLPGEKLEEILATIDRTLEKSTVQSVEYQLELASGQRHFEARMSPFGGDRVIAVVRDITDRREAERKRLELEGRIQHTQKLESLGVLAGGIAHDFNNILMTILGNADLAMMSIPDSSPARSFLGEIVNAASTASDLARQMLAYSGRSEFEIHPLDLNEVVLELTHMLEVSISKKAVLRFRFAEKLPRVMADSAQIRQVIMNLITNASEAIGDRSGYISITTGAMYCDREYLATTELTDEISEDLYVYLEVADTGSGMDDTVRTQLFEPFFTTKYAGRGLGLSSVLGIVRGHRGAIKVYSEPGEGTTFKVLLPACTGEGDDVTEVESGGSGERWKGSGKVLFADDEDTVLAIGRRMLENMGFDVITAEDGRQAVERFRENADGIILVILDLTMPHLSGDEVYREIRRIREGVPVIVSSGFSQKDVMHRFAGKHLHGFIQKPYRADDLSRVIRRVLEPDWEE